MSDSPSLANLQNKQNRDQQYHAVRCQSNRNSNSNDSGSFKAEGNGRSFGDDDRISFSFFFDFIFTFCIVGTEYIEDICPYATFQLNKQTYSESSYSGNVYSGPYHSVRGSFVYHDVKPDGYQREEPEYTKVRRKGNRLRDPHSESQGNTKNFFLYKC